MLISRLYFPHDESKSIFSYTYKNGDDILGGYSDICTVHFMFKEKYDCIRVFNPNIDVNN